MADLGTLATTAQVLLAIGEDASSTQILEDNTNIWILMAEADIQKTFGEVEIVSQYSDIVSSWKQWLALISSHRAAFYAINSDQNNWQLSTTQSKLNVCNSIWKGFLSDMKENRADIIANMGL